MTRTDAIDVPGGGAKHDGLVHLTIESKNGQGSASSREPSPAPPSPVKKDLDYQWVKPGSFQMESHYYTRVLNAQIHPTVRFFMGLSKERVLQRYCHLNPNVDKQALDEVLQYKPTYLRWAGCDLMHTTTDSGKKGMVVIETNTCPSGMKSTPLQDDLEEMGGYAVLLRRSFLPTVKRLEEAGELPAGGILAVVYDKNPMEASGYATTMAEIAGEKVLLVPFKETDKDPRVRFTTMETNQLPTMEVRTPEGEWVVVRAALRYVTQRPWNRIPMLTRTLIMNPVLACLAGGRNKMVAAKAYDNYNNDLALSGLKIHTPYTIRDVVWDDIPNYIEKLGGHAVIKVPYSNAGQGVYTVTCKEELDDFIRTENGGRYDKFIIQSLVSNYKWSSDVTGGVGRLYHVGTIPNRKGESFVSDLRLMVSGSDQGFQVVGMYARRARAALVDELEPGMSSWDMLGTNLSVAHGDGVFSTESDRLLLMDRKDFNVLGMGLDDLIEAYIQTVLCVVAIDRMSMRLTNEGRFSKLNFKFVNNDDSLLSEIIDDGAFEPKNVLEWMESEASQN